MNGRRSFDPVSSKPFNINIYYNINSKNITNNHEVQSHPATARVLKNDIDTLLNSKKNQTKPKSNKTRKKKYSVDLSGPTQKKGDKIGKKSNTNSICSGFPSRTQYKKQIDKQEDNKKSQGNMYSQKNQQKLGQLLQIFSEGKIDKAKLTKQIINIFQLQQKQSQQTKEKKITKKKRSVSTLMGTTTPKNNQLFRGQQATSSIKIPLNIHKARKRQSKSQRSSFTNSKNNIFRNQFAQKIIECKNIDSSLFLQHDDEEKVPIVVDRTNDVQTSYSIVLLNENLKKEREMLAQQPQFTDIMNLMAKKIQRTWRKYKTRRIIGNILNPVPKIIIKTSNSLLQKVELVSSKNSLSVQNFLSQELNRRNNVKQTEIARVDELRDHEIKKWNQIIDYVKISMNNRHLSSDQCLKQIIEYFQNAKNTVQKELFIEKAGKKQDRSREITEFTNKAVSKQMQRDQEIQNQVQDIQDNFEEEKQDEELLVNNQEYEEEEQREQIQHDIDESSQSQLQLQLQCQRLTEQRITINPRSNQNANTKAQKSEQLSLQVLESTLIKHLKRLQTKYSKKLKLLDIHSTHYLQQKKQLEREYKQSKKQIKRIIIDLNKGYIEAKNILEKDIFISDQSCLKSNNSNNSRENLQKCKSDNYLLKTAINYKKYIEKKERNQHKQDKDNSQVRPLTKAKHQDNLQINSIESSELSEPRNNLNKAVKIQPDEEQGINHFIENKSSIFQPGEEGGQGCILNNLNNPKFTKLQQKVISQQFLQYEQIHKKFDEQDEKSQIQISLKSDNNQSVKAQQISLFENTKINEINKKLKYLTNEDKDDIFEFLFIDLTLELVTQCDQQSRVYQSIRKYVEKKRRLESIPKGVKTSLQSSKDYLNLVAKNVITEHHQLYLRHIVVPMGPTAKEMLKYMHEDQQGQQNDSNQEISVPLILPVPIFEKIQSKIIAQYPRYYDDDAKEHSRRKFLKSVDHIHHKALFDCLNQSLDAERPYGIWGVPFPWKTTYKNNRNFDWDNNKKLQKLQMAIQKVIQSCSYMCGILADKEQSVFGNHRVSQNYVDQIRQDRMSKMLANELLQGQDRWAFFDDEQTQVVIQLARYIMLSLIDQFLKQQSVKKVFKTGLSRIDKS